MKKLIRTGIISLAAVSALMGAGNEGDIVFVIDESGSMGPKIQTVIDNVGNLVTKLENHGVDYQLGLVGFGSYSKGNPRVVTKLTDDNNTFVAGLQALLPVYGGFEPGFSAVTLGMSAAMEPLVFRPDAGTCVIMLTDEDADDPTNKQDAVDALSNKGAVYYGVVNISGRSTTGEVGNTANDYGPKPDSLSEVTGGAVWDVADLGSNGDAILAAVLDKCISETIIPNIEVSFDVHPQSCPNPINIKSKGLTPMAILGTADFDVNDINVSTLLVNGYPVTKLAYEDVAEPYTGEQSEELNRNKCWEFEATDEVPEYLGDGFMDLTFKLKTRVLVDELTKGVQELNITGQTNDGTPIDGSDVVWVK